MGFSVEFDTNASSVRLDRMLLTLKTVGLFEFVLIVRISEGDAGQDKEIL